MDHSIYDKLLPGEEILWEGQPQNKTGFSLENGCSSMFGIVWLAFSLFWTGAAFLGTRQMGETDATGTIFKYIFPLFGLPFVLIGIYIVFIAPQKHKKRTQSTYYYVTNKRIIINVDAQNSPTFNSVLISDLKDVQITKHRDNTGTIYFPNYFSSGTHYSSTSSGYSRTSYSTTNANSCFSRIQDADDVYKLIAMHQQLADIKENQYR